MPLIAPSPAYAKPSRHSAPWFGIGMVGIFVLSLILRFWGLSRFNTLVFDEVYYAKFASAFLKGETVFTGHPPLSTYIIAIGIWIGEHLPWGNSDPKNGLAGLLLSPFSYRWLNALTGSFIPLLVGAIAYQLLHRRSYAFIAALFVAADGLFLVESRYALNNVYLILFGLLGNLFFLLALQTASGRRWLYLIAAGIGFGASASIKWNGLGFLLGAYAVWAIGWLVHWVQAIRASFASPETTQHEQRTIYSPLQNIAQLHLGHALIALAIVPALTYYLCWLPYLYVDPSNSTFWQLQMQTLDYHERVGGLNAHPYCSLWYTWPLMLRPVAYFYKTSQDASEASPIVGPPLPANTGTVIYDVHAMGNPILWWLSTTAVLLLALLLLQQIWQGLRPASASSIQAAEYQTSPVYVWTVAYLLINWAANLLPWVEVTRCLFIYHYMESLVFAVLLLALMVDRWFSRTEPWRRTAAILLTALILIGFIFWMPLYLGLPLSPVGIEMRRWLTSWI